VAVSAGLVAGYQANLASERATVAEARRVAATALEEPDFDRALLLAVEARHIWDSSETRTNLVRVFTRAPRVTSITRIQEAGVTPASMSLEEDGTRAAVIDSDDDLRLLDLASQSQLGDYSPIGGIVAATAVDPVSGTVAFSAALGLCNALPCDRGRTGKLDLANGGRAGLKTYQGLAGAAADIEYSADGSLFAALEATLWFEPSGSVALWRGGGGDPILMNLNVSGSDPGPSEWGGQFGALKFAPDGSRLYASRLGPTVVFDTSSGNEIDRVAGTGLLAVSPDGRRIAVRDGRLAVRIVDSSGMAAPATVPLSVIPTVADFSPDGQQLAIASGNRVEVVNTETGDIAETLLNHNGAVTAAEFQSTGILVTAGADGAFMTWDLGDWSAGFRIDPFSTGAPFVEENNERTLVLEQSDGTTQVVVAEPAAWEDRACRVAGRVLTEQEWRDQLGDKAYSPACRD
jgi:WD40 repeat protein